MPKEVHIQVTGICLPARNKKGKAFLLLPQAPNGSTTASGLTALQFWRVLPAPALAGHPQNMSSRSVHPPHFLLLPTLPLPRTLGSDIPPKTFEHCGTPHRGNSMSQHLLIVHVTYSPALVIFREILGEGRRSSALQDSTRTNQSSLLSPKAWLGGMEGPQIRKAELLPRSNKGRKRTDKSVRKH